MRHIHNIGTYLHVILVNVLLYEIWVGITWKRRYIDRRIIDRSTNVVRKHDIGRHLHNYFFICETYNSYKLMTIRNSAHYSIKKYLSPLSTEWVSPYFLFHRHGTLVCSNACQVFGPRWHLVKTGYRWHPLLDTTQECNLIKSVGYI